MWEFTSSTTTVVAVLGRRLRAPIAVVALTARSLAPSLRIVSRVTDVTWRERLMRAGASHTFPVYESVGAGSRAEGKELRDLMDAAGDAHILGLRHEAGLTR